MSEDAFSNLKNTKTKLIPSFSSKQSNLVSGCHLKHNNEKQRLHMGHQEGNEALETHHIVFRITEQRNICLFSHLNSERNQLQGLPCTILGLAENITAILTVFRQREGLRD